MCEPDLPLRSVALVDYLAERDGNVCWYCGGSFTLGSNDSALRRSIEHLIPRNVGGHTCVWNCVLAHAQCNSLVGDARLYVKFAFRDAMHDGFWRREAARVVAKVKLLQDSGNAKERREARRQARIARQAARERIRRRIGRPFTTLGELIHHSPSLLGTSLRCRVCGRLLGVDSGSTCATCVETYGGTWE